MNLLSRNKGTTHKAPNVNSRKGSDQAQTVFAILECPRTSVSKY